MRTQLARVFEEDLILVKKIVCGLNKINDDKDIPISNRLKIADVLHSSIKLYDRLIFDEIGRHLESQKAATEESREKSRKIVEIMKDTN